MSIQERLFAVQDQAYASFQSRLVPTLASERFIGVRMPEARKLARSLKGTDEADKFMVDLPHYYYEENILQVLLISEIQDYAKCLAEVEGFLPYSES
ncbi:MAG: hypothetical protein Q4E09_05110 [Eubacteriales bacterium]|nr:hypothetical protein [Eubacteriales bacterium]